MSIKNKWLKVLMLSMIGIASFAGARMNPQEIEDVLHIMNETKIEFTIPDDEGDKSDGKGPLAEFETVHPEKLPALGGKTD